jgi:hypothetical protein
MIMTMVTLLGWAASGASVILIDHGSGPHQKTFDSHIRILDLHYRLRTFSVFGSCYLLYLSSTVSVYVWGSGISR